MLIPCKDIALIIEEELKTHVSTKITLVAYLLGESPEQLSFVAIKRRLAQRLGIEFDFNHYPVIPSFSSFIQDLQIKMADSENTGVIIQLPLPAGYDNQKIFEVVPSVKDIEGHTADSPFQFPLSLAVLTGIKYIFAYARHNKELDNGILVHFDKDKQFFREVLQDKNIVIVGRGATGGKPIAECFDKIGVTYSVIHSQTLDSNELIKKADIIITATGKKIVEPKMLKKGVILLNVGLRKEDGKLKGDYDEEEIKDIASYYTQTPGGLGPLDVLYLYKNLIEAAV